MFVRHGARINGAQVPHSAGWQGDLIKIICWVSHCRATGPRDNGARGRVSVLQAIGEGPVRVALGQRRQDRADTTPAEPYCAQLGGAQYRARRKRCGRRHKLVAGGWLHDFVRGKLIHRRWSPTQIACKLRAMHPEDPNRLGQPRDHLCRDLRAAERRAESQDDRSTATAQTRSRIAAHDAGGRLYRPGIVADHPPT